MFMPTPCFWLCLLSCVWCVCRVRVSLTYQGYSSFLGDSVPSPPLSSLVSPRSPSLAHGISVSSPWLRGNLSLSTRRTRTHADAILEWGKPSNTRRHRTGSLVAPPSLQTRIPRQPTRPAGWLTQHCRHIETKIVVPLYRHALAPWRHVSRFIRRGRPFPIPPPPFSNGADQLQILSDKPPHTAEPGRSCGE